MEYTLFILFAALIMDWFLGEPKLVWNRIPHPVVLIGKAVTLADDRLNIQSDTDDEKIKKGSIAIAILIIASLGFALVLQIFLQKIGAIGIALEAVIVFVFIAQRSLYDHVEAIQSALQSGGLKEGRKAVALIVGRDPNFLDKTGVCRAAIESLAENFSDGVVAPAFWYAVFGLPGLFAYKIINTADSMIAYKNEKYLHFGRTTAIIDDLANWLPARISVFLIAAGSGVINGLKAMRNSVSVTLRDAGLHRSPNAGWPESAMAGGANIALGGPRQYANETVDQAFINAAGKRKLEVSDISKTLKIFSASCFAGWVIIGILAFI